MHEIQFHGFRNEKCYHVDCSSGFHFVLNIVSCNFHYICRVGERASSICLYTPVVCVYRAPIVYNCILRVHVHHSVLCYLLIAVVPSCVRSSESSIQISWTVMSDRSYSYKIRNGNLNFSKYMQNIQFIVILTCLNITQLPLHIIIIVVHISAKTVSGARSSGNFVVSGGRGTLTITTQGEWPIGVFKVTINDLSSSIPSMKTASFKVKKGLWQCITLMHSS